MPNNCLDSQPAGNTLRCLRSATLVLALALCLLGGFVPALFAQKAKPRKIISDVKPTYPATLKSRGIEGKVHLTAIVLPNGTVAAVEVHGGNPILVENAVKAIKSRVYAPGPTQTEEDIILNFGDK